MTQAPAFSGPELCRLEATEVVALLRRREIAPSDLIDAAASRIAAVEPAINALPTLCLDRARDRAAALDDAGAGHPGWLAGLPIAIKDLTEVAGVLTTFGNRGLAHFVPKASHPLVLRLEGRGGVVLGKSNTPEFGAGGNTFNEVFGPTLNPWDCALNAGGSSGGAAAALAAGEVWLSHGSDHGGSLRTPAAYCGIVGLRPSPGRVPGNSERNAFQIESQQGPMARSVRDCALFLDAMAGFDPGQPTSFPAPEAPFGAAVERAEGRLRIAWSPDLGGFAPVDAEMVEHLQGALHRLARNGAVVEETCPPLPDLERSYHTLRGTMWVAQLRGLPESVTRHFKQTLRQNTDFGLGLTIADVADAQTARSRLFHNMLKLFDSFDVLACPVVGCMPHPQSEEWVHEVGGQSLTGYMDWLRFAFLATVTGLPAISVPVGLGPRGLPVGLQLIGRPRGEAALLQAARAVELACGGPLGPIDPRAPGQSG